MSPYHPPCETANPAEYEEATRAKSLNIKASIPKGYSRLEHPIRWGDG